MNFGGTPCKTVSSRAEVRGKQINEVFYTLGDEKSPVLSLLHQEGIVRRAQQTGDSGNHSKCIFGRLLASVVQDENRKAVRVSKALKLSDERGSFCANLLIDFKS